MRCVSPSERLCQDTRIQVRVLRPTVGKRLVHACICRLSSAPPHPFGALRAGSNLLPPREKGLLGQALFWKGEKGFWGALPVPSPEGLLPLLAPDNTRSNAALMSPTRLWLQAPWPWIAPTTAGSSPNPLDEKPHPQCEKYHQQKPQNPQAVEPSCQPGPDLAPSDKPDSGPDERRPPLHVPEGGVGCRHGKTHGY